MNLTVDTVYFDQGSYNAGMIADDSFESLKEKNHRRKIRRNIFYILIGLLLCVVFAIACIALFFNAKEIKVEGVTLYDAALIREGSGIEPNQNLYSINRDTVAETITMNYPYIKSVDVEFEFPAAVTLRVTEDTPCYYFELCGEYLVLSDSLRVLEHTKDLTELQTRLPGLIGLNTLSIRYAVCGERIVFTDANYYDYARQMLNTFSASAIADKITWIDFSDKFNIFVIYDGRFKIEIGNMEDISSKISFAQEILSKFEGHYSGVVNVESDPGFAILDSTFTER